MPALSKLRDHLRTIATTALPLDVRLWARAQQRRFGLQAVKVGSVEFGTLRRLSPISPIFGKDRDLVSVERHYIERFLGEHAGDVRGRTLEMGDPAYTMKFGGDRVTQADVLHYVAGNPQATFVADLTDAPGIPDDTFDCIIITQTLQMIYDVPAAIATLFRILKPGGVVLATSHGISRVARREGVDDWGEYWHFTSQSSRRLFRAHFGDDGVTIRTYGNVLASVASLHGLASRELDLLELDFHDPNFELIIGVRAIKAPRAGPERQPDGNAAR
ncbi:MAG: methyltransferase domain-containing protein [Casimicrobiaceae bacterium]